MTRQEELVQAARKEYPEWEEAQCHYIDGAHYADSHPHWISVEDYSTDELPPMLNDKDPYGESVCVLFVVELNGNQYINKGCFDYDIGVWHSVDANCSYLKENVTHWMPMPSVEHLKEKE